MPQRLLLFLVWSCGFEQREKQCHHDQARGIFKTAQFPSGNWRFGIGHLAQIHWQVFPWIGRLESKRNRRFLFEGTECLSEGTEFCGDLRQIVHLIMELSRCEKKNKAKCFEIFFQICGWSFRLTCFCSEVLTCTDVVVMQKPGILGGCVHRGHAEDLPRLCEKSQGSLSFCFKHATNCQVITPGWEERVLFQPEMWWHQWHGGGSGQPIFFFQVILFHVLHLVITSWFIGQRLKTLLQVVKNFEVLKTWFEFFGRDTPYGNEIKACLVFCTLRLICWQQYIYGFQTSGVLHLQVAVLELNESLRVLDDGRKSDKKARGTWMEFIPISIRNSSKVKCLDLAISGSSGGGHEDSTGLQSTSDWHAHAWATIPKIKAGEHTKTTHTHILTTTCFLQAWNGRNSGAQGHYPHSVWTKVQDEQGRKHIINLCCIDTTLFAQIWLFRHLRIPVNILEMRNRTGRVFFNFWWCNSNIAQSSFFCLSLMYATSNDTCKKITCAGIQQIRATTCRKQQGPNAYRFLLSFLLHLALARISIPHVTTPYHTVFNVLLQP